MDKKKSILVVDDEVYNFDVIEALLFRENYNLSHSADGFQALEFLAHNQPDLILLDVMMPGLDGIEVCRRLKSDSKLAYIPILVITALSSKEDLDRCLKAGADDFISKPIEGIELRARVRSMLRIKQQYDLLQETLQMREDMSAIIVHDLRNPLTSITCGCEILLSNQLEKQQKYVTEQIFASSQRSLDLIDDLLIMAKMESGKLKLNKKLTNISESIEQITISFQRIANRDQIKLITQLPEENIMLSLDGNLFCRLLENLISNAIKISPENSHITIKLSPVDTTNQKIQIQVCDQGMGVKDDLKESIFNKYETGTRFKNVKQTGLGLAFCKMVVDAHQGSIFVEDNQPQGSIFTIQL